MQDRRSQSLAGDGRRTVSAPRDPRHAAIPVNPDISEGLGAAEVARERVYASRRGINRRERQVITRIARGKADIDIVDIIGCSYETTRGYAKAALRKLYVITWGQMVEIALRLGIIHFSLSVDPNDSSPAIQPVTAKPGKAR